MKDGALLRRVRKSFAPGDLLHDNAQQVTFARLGTAQYADQEQACIEGPSTMSLHC